MECIEYKVLICHIIPLCGFFSVQLAVHVGYDCPFQIATVSLSFGTTCFVCGCDHAFEEPKQGERGIFVLHKSYISL